MPENGTGLTKLARHSAVDDTETAVGLGAGRVGGGNAGMGNIVMRRQVLVIKMLWSVVG